MTRRAHPYLRTRSTSALLAAASACLAAVTLAPAADAAATGGASALSGSAGTSTSAAVAVPVTAADPANSGGAAMTTTITTAATTPTTTAVAPTVTTAPASSVTSSVGTGKVTSGGTGLSSSSVAQAADPLVTASSDGFTLAVHASGLTAQKLIFTGTAPAGDVGDQIVLQRADAGAPGVAAWVEAGHATVAVGGTFKVGWTADQSGRFQVRAVLGGVAVPATGAGTATSGQAAAATVEAPPAVDVTIFKAADATFYGPGLWGRHTACGEVLHRSTLGVANRTLKCGTEVNVYFNGNEITVPVIDRGPYVTGVDWDLTKAAANAVGLTDQIGRGTIGTLVVDTLTTGTL